MRGGESGQQINLILVFLLKGRGSETRAPSGWSAEERRRIVVCMF
jgi:hypothetical protein